MMLNNYTSLFGSVAGAVAWLLVMFLLSALYGLWLYKKKNPLAFPFRKKKVKDTKHGSIRGGT